MSKGDNFTYGIQVRTTNNNCRSNSKKMAVSTPLTTIVPLAGDIDGEGMIGLEEAIRAMQILFGIR